MSSSRKIIRSTNRTSVDEVSARSKMPTAPHNELTQQEGRPESSCSAPRNVSATTSSDVKATESGSENTGHDGKMEPDLSRIFPLKQQVRQGLTFESSPPATFTPTKEGNEALKKGREIYRAHVGLGFFGVNPPTPEEISDNGGKEAMLRWFGMFYHRMFQDPRMAVLFDTRQEDANVSAAEHGKRLVLALLSRWTGDASYFQERGNGLFHNVMVAHTRAKKCPLRHYPQDGFTVDQRDSWLGHLWLAGESAQVPLEFRDTVVSHLSVAIAIYGPFVEAPRGKR